MQQLDLRRIVFVTLTLMFWSLVLFGSSSGAGDSWSLKLLRDLFGLEGEALQITNFVLRKSVHVVYYGTLAILISRSLYGFIFQCHRRSVLWGAGLALITGIADEFHQSTTLTRTGTGFDLLYDGAGIALGTWLFILMVKKRKC